MTAASLTILKQVVVHLHKCFAKQNDSSGLHAKITKKYMTNI